MHNRAWLTPLWNVEQGRRPGRADHDTRHAAVQRTSGIGAAETEESVTRGKDQEARKIGQSAELQTGQRHFGRNKYASQVV